jgi:ABC-2 type transport system ATP-binding protein
LADRVTIIREGRAVESGSLDEMRHLHRSKVRAEVVGAVPDLTGVPGVHDLSVDGSVVSCTVEPKGLPAVLTALTAAGVRSLTSTPPSLEELFLDTYRRDPVA